MSGASEKQERVREFWDAKPCDSEVSERGPDNLDYYLEIEGERYRYQYHIPTVMDWVHWEGKKVLEIGTGVGTDARAILRRGGIYTGVNVDKGSVDATAKALKLFNMSGCVRQSSATNLYLDDASVDVIYSFGVLHHIPEVEKAIAEIRRVLRPGGEVVAMLYNRDSINYRLEVMFLRKMVLRMLNIPIIIPLFRLLGFPEEKLQRHAEIYRLYGKLSDQEWLNRNTDGPDNPYSKVYDAQEASELFGGFEIKRNEVYFFDPRHWGLFGSILPKRIIDYLGRRWGWHRMVYAVKPNNNCLEKQKELNTE